MSRHEPERLLRALNELESARKQHAAMERRWYPRVPARGEAELLAIDQTRPKEPMNSKRSRPPSCIVQNADRRCLFANDCCSFCPKATNMSISVPFVPQP